MEGEGSGNDKEEFKGKGLRMICGRRRWKEIERPEVSMITMIWIRLNRECGIQVNGFYKLSFSIL